MTEYESVVFSEAYDLANVVWSHVREWSAPGDFDDFFDARDKEVVDRILKPHRHTLLHLFLQRFYEDHYILGFEYDRRDMPSLVIDEYETILKFSGIECSPYRLPAEDDEAYERKVKRKIAALRKLLPLDRIAQDTFQLLFRDRAFLLQFNKIAARAVKDLCLERKWLRRGRTTHSIPRVRLPAWLKQGVFFRDNGRCVACARDLTGAVVTSEAVHYDHIVSLAEGGSNDPTNFQLMCSECNQHKSASVQTSERFPVFWSVG